MLVLRKRVGHRIVLFVAGGFVLICEIRFLVWRDYGGGGGVGPIFTETADGWFFYSL